LRRLTIYVTLLGINKDQLNEIEVTDPILDYLKEGAPKPVETPDGPLTFRAVFDQALNSSAPNEVTPAEKKSKQFALTLKLYASNEVDLTVDEASLIKERVGLIWTSPLIYGRVCELLDK
jgi:hypothetical protein